MQPLIRRRRCTSFGGGGGGLSGVNLVHQLTSSTQLSQPGQLMVRSLCSLSKLSTFNFLKLTLGQGAATTWCEQNAISLKLNLI